MDQVLVDDGRIMRVLGTLDNSDYFFAFTLYSPDQLGSRIFKGRPYRKYNSAGNSSDKDVLSSCSLVPYDKVVEVFDPIATAISNHQEFSGTIWHKLYSKLTELVGENSVGILGSALSGLYKDAGGQIINDVDFFIEGLDKIGIITENMPSLREELGFTDYDPATLEVIKREIASSYRNPYNTLDIIISRRWSGMQTCTNKPVRNTLRFRDKHVITPTAVVSLAATVRRNVHIRGTVRDAIGGNLFPRTFSLKVGQKDYFIYSLWWKISSPVVDGDDVEICADEIKVNGTMALRLSHFDNHFLHIHN